jgi:hypothetical protein
LGRVFGPPRQTRISVILNPEQYENASAYQLLVEAARGYVPLDRRLARALLARGEAVFPEFVQFLKEPRDDDRVDAAGFALEIARQSRAPAAVSFLAEYARAADFEFPDELTEGFIEMGEASVDPLLALHAESGGASDVRFALSGLGVRDPRILETLLDLLKADPVEGSIMLGLYGDPAAKPALEQALAAAGGNERLRQEIEAGIREIDVQETARPEPFDIWPLYPEEDMPYFAAFDTPELLEFLASGVAEYRIRAVRALTFDEAPPDVAGKILDVARTDPDVRVRAIAWECLEGLEEPAEIAAALRARLEDATAPLAERAGALVALARDAENDEALARLVLEFHERPETRAQAVKAMWHSGDRRFESRIAQALDDPDLGVRRQAVTAVGMFSMVSQLGRLERLFEEEDLREAALYSYALAAPSEVTPARMKKLFGRIETLAGGFSQDEGVVVGVALDDRLRAHDLAPVFHRGETWEDEEPEPAAAAEPEVRPAKVGRNDPCPCGSGKKYKKCCGQ